MNRWIARLIMSWCVAWTVQAESPPVELAAQQGEPGPVPISLANEGRAAVDRAVQWLLAQQQEDGHWSNPDFPALTGLPLWALALTKSSEGEAVDKAVQYIVSCAHDDGSIWREPKEERKGGGLSNYNTAICMVALHALGDPALVPVVQKARRFVANSQHLGGDVYEGGMGYDPETGRPYADLSNTYVAYEAMRLTENVEDLRGSGEARADLDWEAARRFISRIQNLPGSNDQPWASDDPDNKGGFIYKPDHSMAGTTNAADGTVRFRSYGSMTYAGLLSFIYAKTDRSDPRVQSAFDWAARHWTLDENPGMGAQGLFYFYSVLSKGLAIYGQDQIPLPDGRQVNWRNELIRKLLSLQKIDPATGHGYWVNEEGRWWEADPVLVTSYSIIAMEIALGR
ncbi:MAG: terpene cyclase/mutase family protein [Verrucomicrobia bacterium]|nr:terpene cyclase/mutase family protein [Verrucomicrobiota bacterium]MBU1910381.1 terpene cyclase/mutase family protein [Verrucomicrobiota bacterium]